MLSDPVRLRLPAASDLVVSIYLPRRTPGTTIHAFSFQDNVVAAGNVTRRRVVEPTATFQQWYFLSGVSVSVPRQQAAAVVALGDSITDGANTTPNTNSRWPDVLARRLQATRDLRHLGVLNEGISGNRLLHDPNPPPGSDAEAFAAFFGQSALRRFDRDVGAQPGARYVIVLLGVNDLGHPGTVAPESEEVSVADLIGGYRQLIARAHEQGLRVFGGTITPFKGDTFGFYSPANEAARQAVNRWIRTSGEYDAVVDFDAALRDPAEPDRLLPAYDSGDHLHPNDAGAAAMARAVPLRLFR
jgi:lysophospholipase L1-like esterase